MYSGQDWETVVIRKPKPKAPKPGSADAIAQAKKEGAPIETHKKYGAGANKHSVGGTPAKKLDDETDIVELKKMSGAAADAIKRKRAELKMTQKEFAVKINERESIVHDYERGEAIPSQAILIKMERVLGVKLRGKDIGTPIEKRGGEKEKS
eukprot:TRINITY_DN4574_c0_g1_i1.p1 TRINITY_DN4574_c0_g1~~TRINITY_DN4574_c0_g1_i1.p1  ORF type:complete len:152 (-),score=42.79 TRINITY_DN4574_c0_g1_i1:220-675(-)